ncbi:MAG TPA: Mut7-C RNAse domain-containing protein [Burkholderiales bacterium]|nr:Mut7-C RNAse domain-containing protein [Burkholderiales bacterium]
MSSATFSFHGELTDFIARERRGVMFNHACARAATIKHAIESLGVPHTEAGRIMVNNHPATLERIVREGDLIEVYPYLPVDTIQDKTPEFVADAHLGGLARMLRMLGLDTLYESAISDREIIEAALRERRIVLSRDRELLKIRDVARGCFVHARKPEAQLREVAIRYGLERHMQPFTLCLHCNYRLETIEKREVAGQIPQRIYERYAEFTRCPGCARIYWQGSHWARMREMLDTSLTTPIPVNS